MRRTSPVPIGADYQVPERRREHMRHVIDLQRDARLLLGHAARAVGPRMTEPKSPVIELPRFSDEVRTSVPDDEGTFDDFEAMLESWIARFTKARAAAQYEERRLHETGLVTARRQGVYVLAGAAIRILDLGAGIVLLVNARRAHAPFALARALFETCASLSYVHEEVLPRPARGRRTRSPRSWAEFASGRRIASRPKKGGHRWVSSSPGPGRLARWRERRREKALRASEMQRRGALADGGDPDGVGVPLCHAHHVEVTRPS
jgi:hypothetical protein